MTGQAVTAELLAVVVAMVDGRPSVLTLGEPPRCRPARCCPATARCRRPPAPGSRSRPDAGWATSSSCTPSPTSTATACGGRDRSRSPTSASPRPATSRASAAGRTGTRCCRGRTPAPTPARWTDVIAPRLDGGPTPTRPWRPSAGSGWRSPSACDGHAWQPDLVLQRYELLYESRPGAGVAGGLAASGRGTGRPATGWSATTAACSPPGSPGCGPRSATGRWCSS